MRDALRWTSLLLLTLTSSGCIYVAAGTAVLTYHESRAGEAVIYETPKLELRVVRYRQADAFSTISYTYEVECGSEGNWTRISSGGDSASPNAAAIAKRLREEFRLFGDDIVVRTMGGYPLVYTDRCKSLRQWDPLSVDAALIDAAPIWPKEKEPAPLEAKPWFCAKPEQDCRRYEFGGERRIHYENTTIQPDGTITFDARSTAFRDGITSSRTIGDRRGAIAAAQPSANS